MMKKLICMVLAILLFAGCSAGPRPDETKSAPTTAGESASVPTAAARPEPLGPGLYLLCTYTAEDGWRPTAMAAGGNAAVVLLSPVPADPDRPACCIQTLDLETGTAGPILPLENAGDFDGYLLSIEDDGSLVYYDPYKETAAHYDPQGRLLGRIDNPFPAGDDPRFPHRLANQYFTFQGPVAWYHSYTPERFLFTAYAFADEPEENGVQGRVTLQFTVEADGRVTNVRVLRGVDESLDKEAVRVVSSSPKWTPGRQRDRAVKVTYTFPVIFQLR